MEILSNNITTLTQYHENQVTSERECVCVYTERQQILRIHGVPPFLKITTLRSHRPRRLLDRRCLFSLKFAIPVNPLILFLVSASLQG